MRSENERDLVVVGGGSAGLIAARTAADLGARVLLVESHRLGGDCLWTGCVPSKALLASAREGASGLLQAWEAVRRAQATIAHEDSVATLNARGVDVLFGSARFTSPRELDLQGQQLRFGQAVIATGSVPAVPPIAGLAAGEMLTTDTVWDIMDLPQRLLIVGGGPAGCELGQAFARLGTSVALVTHGSRLLPREDAAASEIVADALRSDGVTLHLGRRASRVELHGTERTLVLDGGTRIAFDRVLAATGRRARTAELGLEAAGVLVDPLGFVRTTPWLRTANHRIWAAGDVTAAPKYTHVAGTDGALAATNALLGLRRRTRWAGAPRVTFTSPEVAAVGVSAEGVDRSRYRVRIVRHSHSDRAVTEGATRGYTRLLVDRRGRVVGGTIVGPRAGETLGELALAVGTRTRASTIAGTVHPYPTFNDPLWNAAIADYRGSLQQGASGVVVRLLGAVRSARLRRRP